MAVALSEMGMDFVMTVIFRSSFEKRLRPKVSPTLVWKCPTVNHLVNHLVVELEV